MANISFSSSEKNITFNSNINATTSNKTRFQVIKNGTIITSFQKSAIPFSTPIVEEFNLDFCLKKGKTNPNFSYSQDNIIQNNTNPINLAGSVNSQQNQGINNKTMASQEQVSILNPHSVNEQYEVLDESVL